MGCSEEEQSCDRSIPSNVNNREQDEELLDRLSQGKGVLVGQLKERVADDV